MAQARSNVQLPIGAERPKGFLDAEREAFEQGLELGKEYVDVAARRVAAWAEDHPGQLLLAGLAAGFVLGQIWFRRRRLDLSDLDLE